MSIVTVDDRIARLVADVLIGSPVARTLGLVLDVLAVDRVVLRLPFAAHNVTVGRIVHGGVLASLIDVAGAAASASGCDADAIGGGATSAMAISYLAPADGVDLTAEAVVVQRSRGQTVSDVTVRDPAGTIVAKALLTSRIFARNGARG